MLAPGHTASEQHRQELSPVPGDEDLLGCPYLPLTRNGTMSLLEAQPEDLDVCNIAWTLRRSRVQPVPCTAHL
jgi:hypothetical protein